MGYISNTIEAESTEILKKAESQKSNLRLQLILLFYDDNKWYEKLINNAASAEDDLTCTQNSRIFANAGFVIEGEEESGDTENKQVKLCIPEKLTGNKEKNLKLLRKFQKRIINEIFKYSCMRLYEEKYLDILIPKDNDLGVVASIYELFLLDKYFINECNRLNINIKKSTISILYPQKTNDEIDKPNKMDAKIAALMSHYVYFYLDWLEYVHVHINANLLESKLEKYKQYNYESDNENEDIIKEFNILVERENSLFRSGFLSSGKEKVKLRVINRLREIAKAANYSNKILSETDYADIKKCRDNFIISRNAAIEKIVGKKEGLFYEEKNNILFFIEKELSLQDDEQIRELAGNEERNDILSFSEKELSLQDNKQIRELIDKFEKADNHITKILEIVKKKFPVPLDEKNNKLIKEEIKKQLVKYEQNGIETSKMKAKISQILDSICVLKEMLAETPKKLDELKDVTKREARITNILDSIYTLKEQFEIKAEAKRKLDELEDATKREAEFDNFLDDICALNVYIDVLLNSKKDGRPIGFYELYDKFGYWDYIDDENLKKEAENWYVSHPYIVFKNDWEQIYNNKSPKENNHEIEDDANKAYDKIAGVIPRKTQEIFIYKNKYGKNEENHKFETTGKILVYNTVLTHGMDQLSGYGGLLFTKIEKKNKKEKVRICPKKFAYCTKGTDVNSFNDWILTDVLQGVSGFSLQHVHNVKNAITINDKVKGLEGSIPLFFCGHSLGGGLASAGAIASKGRHAITFNAAGLNFLGVLATRTVGGFNYSFNVPKMVHPIRIDGEAIDVLMWIARFATGGLNERAYGANALILKLGEGIILPWHLTLEWVAKHGINNFLYKPLMDALEIVDKRTIKVPVEVPVSDDGTSKVPVPHVDDSTKAPAPDDGTSKVKYKNISIATLGMDKKVVFREKTIQSEQRENTIQQGNYAIEFNDISLGNSKYISVAKFSLEECVKDMEKLDKDLFDFLMSNFFWESSSNN